MCIYVYIYIYRERERYVHNAKSLINISVSVKRAHILLVVNVGNIFDFALAHGLANVS